MEKYYRETPLMPMQRLNNLTGRNFQVKMECYQPVGSFKIRGISEYCKELRDSGVRHFVSSSGGNAGLATAYCARAMGLKCTVCIPGKADTFMAEVIRQQGATVIGAGDIFDDVLALAKKIAAEDPEAAFVHPFDHPSLWRGHSTLVDELTRQTEKPDAIVMSVGGGGLLNGVVEGLDRVGWGDVRIVGVEVEGAPKFRKAIEAGRVVELEKIDTLATTLAGKMVSAKSLEYYHSHDMRSVLISDRTAAEGMFSFTNDFRVLVELACGASASLAYTEHEALAGCRNVVVIACGGAGVDIRQLDAYRRIFSLQS